MINLFIVGFVLFLSSCAAPISYLQPKVNGLLTDRQYNSALSTLGDSPISYGKKNQLLYWLDKGMILHLAGRFRDSIHAFEQAKRKFDELYTQSLSEIGSSFLLNDYWESYRGNDLEYVLLNVFQALNFVALGEIHESLVEARDLDIKLRLINDRYPKNNNVYRDDAFARLLMGILYQADSSSTSVEDARISLSKAQDVYENDYVKNYGLSAPKFLRYSNERREKSKAYVYLIQYSGFSPFKVEGSLLIPVGGALASKVAFPQYVDRINYLKSSSLIVKGSYGDMIYPTEVGEDIGAIAKQILENRKLIIGAKALARPMIKLAVEKVSEEQLRDKYGDWAGLLTNIIGSAYNLSTEQADLRSWQTLPNEIRIARVELNPGEYQFFVQNLDVSGKQLEMKDLGSLDVKAGDMKFLVVRSYF